MEEIKGVPDFAVRFSSSKNNVQINSKVTGSQSINFQEILTNLGDPDQTSKINTSNQSINIDSLQSQANENELSQNNDNKNINNDKNASTSIKSNNISQGQTALFSEYIPQKPVEVENKDLNQAGRDKKEHLLIKKTGRKNTKQEKPKVKSPLDSIKIIEVRERRNSSSLGNSEDESKQTSITNRKETQINAPQLKENEQGDKEEQNKKNKNEYYLEDDEDISEQMISEIMESYGLEIPDFIAKGGNNQDENWVKNLIFGSVKENLNSDDAQKLSRFITYKNPETIAEKDKKVFTNLVNDIFKHQINVIQPEVFSRFDKNTSEFILKNFPQVIYSGSLKKYFEIDDKKIKDSRLKLFLSFLNNEEVTEKVINEASLFTDEEIEQDKMTYLLQGEYHKLSYEELYNSINKSKEKGVSFGSFVDHVHEVVLECYENNLNEKLKQTVKILGDYKQYNYINETDSQFLAKNLVTKHFINHTLSQTKLVDIMSQLINGEYVEPVYLDLINQSLAKNLLSYLPNTINHQVAEHLKALPFAKNEVINHEDIETFKLFVRLKINQKVKKITITNTNNTEYLKLNVESGNVLFTDLENACYKIKSLETESGENIELSKFDKKFALDFSIDKKTDIFYFGSVEIKINQEKKTVSFKLKNEYKSFLDKYKKNYPELFKKATIKVNPKLFK